MYTVYKHTSPSGKCYIGITCMSPKRRWRRGKGYKDNIYFSNAINKYGWDNFEHLILEENLTSNEANIREAFWIEAFNLTNPEKDIIFRLEGKSFF